MAINARDLFWFAAGLLTALASGFVLAPLLASASSLRARLRLARWPLVAGVLLVSLALALYLWHGSPAQSDAAAAAIAGASSSGAAAASNAAAPVAGSMQQMLTRLEQRLAKQGGSDADWQLLAQTYDFLGRKADAASARTQHRLASSSTPGADAAIAAAVAAGVLSGTASAAGEGAVPGAGSISSPLIASPQVTELINRAERARKARDYSAAAAVYRQLAARGGMSAQTWADYADVAASLNGDKLTGEPERYIDAALAIDPANRKALWLKASALHETRRYAEAIASWQQLLKLTPAGSPDARIFAANLAEDQALGATAAASSADRAVAAASDAPADAGAGQVSGEVALADALRGQVPAGMTVFIVAKSIDTPGPPVAVARTQTGQWPLKFLLDDSLAMLPSRTLSKVGRVTVEARVSRAGTAAPQSGDFQSAVATVDPRQRTAVRLVIDRVIGVP